MFTGFASENTPAIQVWEFSGPFASISAVRSVSLADDCAPIQFFKTGHASVTNAIRVYLPTAPIEGKELKLFNHRYGGNTTSISIYSSDVSGLGTNANTPLYTLGPGGSLTLVYSKQAISINPNGGLNGTGWISLDRGSNAAANYNAVSVGGDNNTAGSALAFVGGGQVNQVTGQSAAIVGGQNNNATNLYTAIVGGDYGNAQGQGSVVVGGSGCTASGAFAVTAGGDNNIANGANSFCFGGQVGTTRAITGNIATSASVSPVTPNSGAQQLATLLLGRQTTDATATRLTSNSSSTGSTVNQVILPNNSAYYVKGSIIATVTGGGNTKAWSFEGSIKRGASAAATAIVGSVILNTIAQDAGASTWIVAFSADTTNGGLAVTVTGQAATTIRWVCKIETTEVTF
jgi:hypothetical protein